MMAENTVTVGDRTFKAVPTSCRCGGSWAWVEIEEGKQTMIGCVCHHTLPIAPSEVIDPVCVCNTIGSGFAYCDLHNNPFKCTCYIISGDNFSCPVHGGY